MNNLPVKQFLNDLIHQCLKHNVTLRLENKHQIAYGKGIKVGGYFSDEDGKLTLAIGTKNILNNWLETLVHESCHLDQYIEIKNFKKSLLHFNNIDLWLSGKRFNKIELEKSFKIVKKFELDCEIRSIKKIKKYNLPINVEKYSQAANLHIHFYNWLKINKKWPKHSIYSEELLNLFPKEISNSHRPSKLILNKFTEVLEK